MEEKLSERQLKAKRELDNILIKKQTYITDIQYRNDIKQLNIEQRVNDLSRRHDKLMRQLGYAAASFIFFIVLFTVMISIQGFSVWVYLILFLTADLCLAVSMITLFMIIRDAFLVKRYPIK